MIEAMGAWGTNASLQAILIYHTIRNSYCWHVIWQAITPQDMIFDTLQRAEKNDRRRKGVAQEKEKQKALVERYKVQRVIERPRKTHAFVPLR
jgi:hypothetical protein